MLLSHVLLLLLNAHLVEILSLVKAAAHGAACHIHAHEAGHGTGGVACRSLHGIGCGRGHPATHHKGVLAVGHGIFHLLDLLHVFGIQSDGIQGDLGNRNTPVYPLCLEGFVHGLLQFIGLGGDLGRTQFHLCQCAERGLQSRNKLCLQLFINDITGISLLHVAADPGIEQQRVGNGVGIHAVAADIHCAAHAQALVHDLEDDGAGRTKFVAHDLLGVEVIHSLILAGVAAVGKALAHGAEGLHQALAEVTRKDGGLSGGVICILTGFGADFHDLALLHDDHALAVGHGNAGAVADHIVAALCVGAASGDPLLTLDHQSVHVQSFTVEKFLPLIGQYTAQCSNTCFNKSHNLSPFFSVTLPQGN